MHMGEHRALRIDSLNPGKCLLDAEVTRMPRIAQRVEDPDIEVFEISKRVLRQIADIWLIGDAAEAEAERLA